MRLRDTARAVLADEILAGAAAGIALGLVEAALLGELGAGLVALALLGCAGVAVGGVLLVVDAIAARVGRIAGALLRALGALPAFVFVARDLFDGAKASQLPGAATAAWWLPALATAGLAVACALGAAIVSRWPRAGRAAVATGALGLAVVAELCDRGLLRSEYPDVHAFLAVVALAALAVALLVGAGPAAARRPGRDRARVLVIVAGVFAITAAVSFGLDDRDSRWAVATRGSHARELVRILRVVLDGDGDGFSALLGGGDCDDAAAGIGPGAPEVPGNGVDEDCDGIDPAPVVRRRFEDAWETWRDSDALAELVARTRDCNLLFISVDTLRADVLDHAPHLRALAADSTSFTRAFASAAGTDLSISTMVTGRINPFQRIERTLWEALSASGRATAAILPREVIRYAGKILLSRGVDRLDSVVNDRVQRDVGDRTTSKETTNRALRDLDRFGDRPFALWVHYFDVHEHTQVEAVDPALAAAAMEGELASPAGRYRALVRVTDAEIGRLLGELEARGLASDTVVVVVSDHGESLGEDPRLPEKHGRYVYNPLVHVPFIVHVPGIAPRTVDAAVSLLDLAPTLVELLGLDMPGLDGRSLSPHLVPGAPAELTSEPRALVINESDQWGLILWPHKLLVRPADNLVELYDLSVDFAESRDLAPQKPELVARLKALYQRFPAVSLDRTRAGRRAREALARPPRDSRRAR